MCRSVSGAPWPTNHPDATRTAPNRPRATENAVRTDGSSDRGRDRPRHADGRATPLVTHRELVAEPLEEGPRVEVEPGEVDRQVRDPSLDGGVDPVVQRQPDDDPEIGRAHV